jgi:hypothetical protein
MDVLLIVLADLSHSDMLVSQGDWEEAAFAGSSNKSRSHNHATEVGRQPRVLSIGGRGIA